MSRETQKIQDDDATNPGTLWCWTARRCGARSPSREPLLRRLPRRCAPEHEGGRRALPAFDAVRGKLLNLGQRIDACHVERQKAPRFAYESKELLALEAYVARQSRGLPIAPKIDAKTNPFLEPEGKPSTAARASSTSPARSATTTTGEEARGQRYPAGAPDRLPIYRLEWQNLGSLERRLRNCVFGIRAQCPNSGADEFVALELYSCGGRAG